MAANADEEKSGFSCRVRLTPQLKARPAAEQDVQSTILITEGSSPNSDLKYEAS